MSGSPGALNGSVWGCFIADSSDGERRAGLDVAAAVAAVAPGAGAR